jgi:NADPH:quinone reductase-like Zn-dependent oxidoreductase
MRAVVQERYGSPTRLRVAQVPRPALGADEVLVRVRATCVHPDVWHVVTGRPYVLRLMGSGLTRPKPPVPGTDVAGVVVEVGPRVTRFRPGDEVFGDVLRGFSWRHGGAFAEYVAAPESGLELKPESVTFEQAATVPTTGFITLLNVPVDRIGPDRRVLVNGAAGGVGLLVVQLAKARGAHVTGVDHPSKLDLVAGVGADEVIDYTRADVPRPGERYHLIVDVPGNHPFGVWRPALTPDGCYVLIGHDQYGRAGRRWLGSLPRFGRLGARSLVERRLRPGVRRPSKREAMATLRALLESGAITPVIDRTFPLEQAATAVAHLASGDARGRVVLTP